MNNDRSSLRNDQWAKIQWILPGKSSDPGRTASDNRTFVEAVVYVARTGVPWRDLPSRFGPWNSVYKRFARWSEKGVWEKVFEVLSQGGGFEMVSLDSTIVRAHQHAAGAQKKRVIKQVGVLAAARPPRFTR
jgi:transposase